MGGRSIGVIVGIAIDVVEKRRDEPREEVRRKVGCDVRTVVTTKDCVIREIKSMMVHR